MMAVRIITRFAPSPTGDLHVGGARTALFNWLYTRKEKGKIILRIEDTDKERSRSEYEKNIMESLSWLRLDFDKVYKQSERTMVYHAYLKKIINEDKAYLSREPAKNDPKREVEVVRLRNKGKKITFNDKVRGKVEFDTSELGNFVIARSIKEPLYHFAAVVDDFEMGITHIIRGEDHISNTPRQILIQEAIGAPRPIYAHISLLLAKDRSKLSKRYGAVSIMEYKYLGYLPDAFINYLALLGWSPGGNREVLKREELITLFNLEEMQKSGAIFSIEKLRWINREHLKKMSDKEFMKNAAEFIPKSIKSLNGYNEERLKKILPVLRERISTFGDVSVMASQANLEYFFEDPKLDYDKIAWKDTPFQKTANHLKKIKDILDSSSTTQQFEEVVNKEVRSYADARGRGEVLWPMRYALSGREKSPSPFILALILGKDITIKRLNKAIKVLESM